MLSWGIFAPLGLCADCGLEIFCYLRGTIRYLTREKCLTVVFFG